MISLPSSSPSKRTRQHVTKDTPPSNTLTPHIRPGWVWLGSLSGFCLAIYCTSVFLGWRAAWKKSQELELEQDADVSNRYDKIAAQYDEEIDVMEKVMRLDGKRQTMCQKAKGHVLEVGVGTGRNGRFYNLGKFGEGRGTLFHGGAKPQEERIKSMMFVDQSAKMLEICSQRWGQQHPHFRGQVDFVLADAGERGAIQPRAGSRGFDTIIQTFGLCSITKPVEYMRTIGDLLKKPDKSGEEGGRILLLEHGIGHYWWINYVLDGLAKEHADRFGCWWNRDIGKIVKDSGLKIVGLKRYHFGTTWALELAHSDVEDSADERKKRN